MNRMKNSLALALALALAGMNAFAATPEDALKDYAAAARKENPAFKAFSAQRGEALYHAERTHSNGGKVSCSTCHTGNPKDPGQTRAHKRIEPMAASANPQRLTDPAKIEKWFSRNCQDVLERTCSAQEKGDFITYLLSVK
jgi:cytochrome c peroxidase